MLYRPFGILYREVKFAKYAMLRSVTLARSKFILVSSAAYLREIFDLLVIPCTVPALRLTNRSLALAGYWAGMVGSVRQETQQWAPSRANDRFRDPGLGVGSQFLLEKQVVLPVQRRGE